MFNTHNTTDEFLHLSPVTSILGVFFEFQFNFYYGSHEFIQITDSLTSQGLNRNATLNLFLSSPILLNLLLSINIWLRNQLQCSSSLKILCLSESILFLNRSTLKETFPDNSSRKEGFSKIPEIFNEMRGNNSFVSPKSFLNLREAIISIDSEIFCSFDRRIVDFRSFLLFAQCSSHSHNSIRNWEHRTFLHGYILSAFGTCLVRRTLQSLKGNLNKVCARKADYAV